MQSFFLVNFAGPARWVAELNWKKQFKKKRRRKNQPKKWLTATSSFRQSVALSGLIDRATRAWTVVPTDRPTGDLIKPFSNDDDGTRPLSNSVGSIDQNKQTKVTVFFCLRGWTNQPFCFFVQTCQSWVQVEVRTCTNVAQG